MPSSVEMVGTSEELWICRLGTVPWDAALAFQQQIRSQRQRGLVPDTLLLLEHPPTVTLGRRAEESEIPSGRESLAAQGVVVFDADRGGRTTCHEPGQLVGYPIMHAKDVVEFIRRIERATVSALAEAGVAAGPREGLTGVWCADRKIGSIGIHVQRGVTTHGFAINCENDLSTFKSVMPCGLPDVEMTSLAREGGEGGISSLQDWISSAFAAEHGLRQRLVTPASLGLDRVPTEALAA